MEKTTKHIAFHEHDTNSKDKPSGRPARGNFIVLAHILNSLKQQSTNVQFWNGKVMSKAEININH